MKLTEPTKDMIENFVHEVAHAVETDIHILSTMIDCTGVHRKEKRLIIFLEAEGLINAGKDI
jgi:hypothetical protein